MARFDAAIEPMTLGNMRGLGVRSRASRDGAPPVATRPVCRDPYRNMNQ
jgi:hypothetical protein